MIVVERVTRTFETAAGDFTAVRDVSFSVAPGRFVSVVGPSGCGKTTLLGLIAGLVPVSEGRIMIGDHPVMGGVPPDIGYLFQRDAMLPWKTALQNVALPLTIRGTPAAETRARATEWMRRVGLAGFEGYYPHQLSGGMRKRVSLATTLIYGGLVTQSGVDTVAKVLDSFEVFKERRVDVATTYDMKYVHQAMKDLKIQ